MAAHEGEVRARCLHRLCGCDGARTHARNSTRCARIHACKRTPTRCAGAHVRRNTRETGGRCSARHWPPHQHGRTPFPHQHKHRVNATYRDVCTWARPNAVIVPHACLFATKRNFFSPRKFETFLPSSPFLRSFSSDSYDYYPTLLAKQATLTSNGRNFFQSYDPFYETF